MYRSILVPLDGSTFAEHALPPALGIARRADAALQLARVVPPLPMVDAEPPLLLDDDLKALIESGPRAYLDATVERLGASFPVPVSRVLLEGEIADALCTHAVGNRVDLVVMATHGRGPLGRFWLGSVADELIRHLPMPVLLVRPQESTPELTAEPPLGRILVPLDGSPLAEQILEPAVALGQPAGAEFLLLRVVKPPLKPAYLPEGYVMGRETQAMLARMGSVHAQQAQEAEEYVDRVADRLRTRGLDVRTRVVVEEQPAVAILREAASPGVGLVALGTHGRRGLSRLILGRVADKVIRGADVPVLVQRPVPGKV